jgi:photosystem II stability/assembly factor-like uncharacterized protein
MFDENTGWALVTETNYVTFILHTADGGLTWKNVTPPDLPPDILIGFFLNTQSAWVYDYNSSSTDLLHTTDGGKTWTLVTKSMPAANVRLTFVNKTDGWAEAYDVGAGHGEITLFGTHDGGATWNQIMLSDPPDTITQSFFPGDLSVCNICGDRFYYDPMRMMVVNGDLASDASGFIRLSVSFDLGKTWKKHILPMPTSQYKDGMVAPQEPVFFNQQDGFLPFNIIKYGPGPTREYKVLAVYATHDGGLSWKSNSTVIDNASGEVDFVSPQLAFAACADTLCVTQDSAQTWQTLKTNLHFAYADGIEYVSQFEFVDSKTGWAITTDGTVSSLWKSVDGGANWTKLSPTLLPR